MLAQENTFNQQMINNWLYSASKTVCNKSALTEIPFLFI